MNKILMSIGEVVDRWVVDYLTWIGGILWDMGGGGSAPAPAAPTTQTVNQVSIPEYMRPQAEALLGKTEALTDINQNPYQQYTGQRIAGFTPLQEQAFQGIGSMQVAPQVGMGTGTAGMAGLGGLAAGQNYAAMATSPGSVSAYMSPYIQNALQPQLEEMRRQYGITGQQLQGQATAQGAFGGNRAALQQAENMRNMGTAMNQAIGTGYQSAFDRAQQAQQFGANLGLQGLGVAGQAAGTLGQLGQSQYGQQMGIIGGQQTAGAQQQALQQKQLETAYQDFINQQNYPYKQLGFMSDVLRGMPTSQSAQAVYQAPPSAANTLLGYGLGAYGLNKVFGSKKGGLIKKYNKGGLVRSNMSQGLAQIVLYKAVGGAS